VSTINGVGTMYYGWQHFADGSATTTKWFVLLYLPIWPLERHKLRVLTDLTKRKHLTPLELVGAALGAAEAVERTRYRILDREPVVGREVAGTYAWTYLLGAVLVAWPALLMWWGNSYLEGNPQWRQSNTVLYAGLAAAVLLIVNPIAVVLIALRRARGFNGGLFE
jgi:hypothetical protein